MQTLELDIEKYDVVEMEATEKEEVDGGWFGPGGVGFRIFMTHGWDVKQKYEC